MNFFYKLITFIFPSFERTAINKYKESKEFYNCSYSMAMNINSKRLIETQVIECEVMVGKPYISISNEWEDPIVGFVIKVGYVTAANSPIPVMKDYISGIKGCVNGIQIPYTPENLLAIYKLTPYERWSIASRTSRIIPDRELRGLIKNYEEVLNHLEENGFNELYKKYKETKEQK